MDPDRKLNHRISTMMPPSTPPIAPLYVNLLQNRDSQDHRTKGRAKAGPRIFYQVHDGLRAGAFAGCDEKCDHSYDHYDDPSYPKDLFFIGVFTNDRLVYIRRK